jgi:hypothetical protein
LLRTNVRDTVINMSIRFVLLTNSSPQQEGECAQMDIFIRKSRLPPPAGKAASG